MALRPKSSQYDTRPAALRCAGDRFQSSEYCARGRHMAGTEHCFLPFTHATHCSCRATKRCRKGSLPFISPKLRCLCAAFAEGHCFSHFARYAAQLRGIGRIVASHCHDISTFHFTMKAAPASLTFQYFEKIRYECSQTYCFTL